ncbi:MAG: cadherin-like domain-containing protein, partial [Saprospiraceae bacterium]|nr:cadherin-like domain-containing protein [Saprospiraceae bacterium]
DNDNDIPTEGTLVATDPTNGAVTIDENGTPSDPSDDIVTYTPDPDFNGEDRFDYTVCDIDNNCSTATVTVIVDPSPDLTDDFAFTNEDESIILRKIFDNDDDIFEGTLTTTDPSNGTVVVDNNGTPNNPSDDVVTYTPDPDYNGEDEFEYSICDRDNNCGTAIITISINPIADAFGDNFVIKYNEETVLDIYRNDNDIPNLGSLSATNPSVGTIDIDDNKTPNDPSDDILTYIPDDGAIGDDSFEYTICDSNDNCSTANVNLKIDYVDVELAQVLIPTGPYSYDDIAVFELTVLNEGPIDLYNVQVNDYLPSGLKYVPTNDSDWSFDPITEVASTMIEGPLCTGKSVTIPIMLEIKPSFKENAWMNDGEVAYMEDVNGEDITNDDIDDESSNGGSELRIYDLALKNQIRTLAPHEIGDVLDFDVTIYNQGNAEVSNVDIRYLFPEGYILDLYNSPGWSSCGPRIVCYNISETLKPRESTTVSLNAEIKFVDFNIESYMTFAEISGADGKGGELYFDADSTPDEDFGNDGTIIDDEIENQNDEDDHDSAVFDLLSEFIVPCRSDCTIKCKELVNVSLDENCSAVITPAMAGVDIDPMCNDYYDIKLFFSDGTELPNDSVDLSHVGQELRYEIREPGCSNKCEGNLNVEYKLPPQLECPDDLTLSCGGLDILSLPPAVATCAELDFEVTLHNETRERLDCDPDYTHRIFRTYRATDELGNFVACSHEILLERVDLTSIMFPVWRTEATGNAISCSDQGLIFDENGVPMPWLNHNIMGAISESGVPFICDPSLTNGVFCPLTGSGAPLIPIGGATTIDENGDIIIIEGEANQICNSAILYTDVTLPTIGCVKKVMRTWEVREWWCSGENTA